MHRCRRLFPAFPLVLLTGLTVLCQTPAFAQTLVPGDHHLRLGEPPLLTLRVRLPEGEDTAGVLPSRCLSASLQPLDPHEGSSLALDWQDAQRDVDGSTWVTFGHPAPLRLMRMLLRATLHCGPTYTRLQQLQADLATPADPIQELQPALATRPPASIAASLPLPIPPRPAPRAPGRSPARPPPVEAPTPSPPAPPLHRPAEAGSSASSSASHFSASSSASPLTDAFVQTWQKDLHALRDELQPLRTKLERQDQRLLAQEDQLRAGLGGLFALGAGFGLVGIGSRAWQERRLRRFQSDAIVPDTSSRSSTAFGSSVHDELEDLWIGTAHTRAEPPASTATPRATLDETGHQALYDEVDALRSTGCFDAAVALLEAATQGEVEQPPGLLLRCLDLYRRLDQRESHQQAAGLMARLYAVDIPDIDRCVLVEELDPSGERARLLACRPTLAGLSNADIRQRLAAVLLADADPDRPRLGWQPFQTALAWHAELAAGRGDQTSTRSMPPLLACCT